MSIEILVGLVSFAALVVVWALTPNQAQPEHHHEAVKAVSPAS
jgi:hypothetical protein